MTPLSENFNSGYFLLSRSVFQSDIWCLKPPEYGKLWVYLIGEAAHADRKYGGYTLKRGQLFRSSKDLQEQISHLVGYRTEKKSVSTVKRILKFLRDTGRITYTSAPRGYVITVLHYDEYQTSANYERTSERTAREPRSNQKRSSINKKDNTEKNGNYGVLREQVVKHLINFNIRNPEAYMRSLENKFSQRVIEKTIKEWNRGGIDGLSDFCARLNYNADLERKNTEEESATALISQFLSPSADADS